MPDLVVFRTRTNTQNRSWNGLGGGDMLVLGRSLVDHLPSDAGRYDPSRYVAVSRLGEYWYANFKQVLLASMLGSM